ncbi:MAG: hypothetical protein QM811_07780 [Pirellulales bacterium]
MSSVRWPLSWRCAADRCAADRLLAQPQLATLGLTRGWFTQAPAGSDGYRVLDAQYHTGELFVLTEAGSLSCFDGATGMRKWHVHVGDPRNNYLPMGIGTNAVAIICGTRLYAVGRKTRRWSTHRPRRCDPRLRPRRERPRSFATGPCRWSAK